MNLFSTFAAIGLIALVPTLAAAATAPPQPHQRSESPGAASAGTSSHAKTAPGKRFRDWTKECERVKDEKRARCYIFQTIALNNSDQPILRAVIGHLTEDPKETVMMLTVPLGVYLPSGLEMEIPKFLKPQKEDYLSCDNNGCRVVIKVTPDMSTALRLGSKAKITIRDSGGQKMTIPLSLHGVNDGLNAL
jgi:invasion protein IalB